MSKFWPEHQLLVADGTTVGGDIWSMSLRTIWGPTPGLRMSFEDQELALKSVADPPFLGLANIFHDYWTQTDEAAAEFPSVFSLVGVKFNSIGPDGKYVYPDTSEVIYSPSVAGPRNAGADPRQSIVVTLRADYDRGRGSFGRFFPPSQVAAISVGATTIGENTQDACGAAALALVNAINALVVDGESITVANVSPGDTVAGTSAITAPVTRIQVDRVVDTQRRRTNNIDGSRKTYPVGV